jgi:chemotaxis methyl-accepting protein methylase
MKTTGAESPSLASSWIGKYVGAAREAGSVWLWSTGMTDWGRDPELWEGFLSHIKPSSRIWCAGIATGEEVITIAARTPDTVSIVATDIRLDALQACTEGRYPKAMVEAAGVLSAEETRRAFEKPKAGEDWLTVASGIRSRIIWAYGDITQGPYPDADLIFCRNTLHMVDTRHRPIVVQRLAETGVPVIIGKSDFLHMHDYWAEHFHMSPTLTLRARG